MKKRNGQSESILLAAALLLISGIGLSYNLHTAEDGEISVSVSRFAEEWFSSEPVAGGDAISIFARANLERSNTIPVNAAADEYTPEYELLEPIITPRK